MAKNKNHKKLEAQITKMTTHLLKCDWGLLQKGCGEFEREYEYFSHDKDKVRYGIYFEPHYNNYVVVEEYLTFRGINCDNVLKSVAYDLLKIGTDDTAYDLLINVLNLEKDSFVYIQKTCDHYSELDNAGVGIERFIVIKQIPNTNWRLAHKNAIPNLPSLLEMDEPFNESILTTRLDELLGKSNGVKRKRHDEPAATSNDTEPEHTNPDDILPVLVSEDDTETTTAASNDTEAEAS